MTEEAASTREEMNAQQSTLKRLFSAFRSRNYRFYWSGQLFSVLALNMEHVALSWLVVVLTESPAQVAAVRETYLAVHAGAKYYVDFKDFAFWRLQYCRRH